MANFTDKQEILATLYTKFSSQMDLFEQASFKSFAWWEQWFKNNGLWNERIFVDLGPNNIFTEPTSPNAIWGDISNDFTDSTSADWKLDVIQDLKQLISAWQNITFNFVDTPEHPTTNFFHIKWWSSPQLLVDGLSNSVNNYDINILSAFFGDVNISLESSNIENYQEYHWTEANDYEYLNSTNKTNTLTFKQLVLILYHILKEKYLDDESAFYIIYNQLVPNNGIIYNLKDFNINNSNDVIGKINESDLERLSILKYENYLEWNMKGGFLHSPLAFFNTPNSVNMVNNDGIVTISTHDWSTQLKKYMFAWQRFIGDVGTEEWYHTLFYVKIPEFQQDFNFPAISWDFNSPYLTNWKYGEFINSDFWFTATAFNPGNANSGTHHLGESNYLLDPENLDEDVLLSVTAKSNILINPTSEVSTLQSERVWNPDNKSPGLIRNKSVSFAEILEPVSQLQAAMGGAFGSGSLMSQGWYSYFKHQQELFAINGLQTDNIPMHNLFSWHRAANWQDALDNWYANFYNNFPQSRRDLENLPFDYLDQFPDTNYTDLTGKDWVNKKIRKKSECVNSYNVYFEMPISSLTPNQINVSIMTMSGVSIPIGVSELKEINKHIYVIEINNYDLPVGRYIIKIYPNEIIGATNISSLFGCYYERYRDGKVVNNGVIDDKTTDVDLVDSNFVIYEKDFMPIFIELELTDNIIECMESDVNMEEQNNRKYITLMDRIPKSNEINPVNYFERYLLYNNKHFEIYDDNETMLLNGTWPYVMYEMYNPNNNLVRWPEYINEELQDKWIIFYDNEPLHQ